MKPVTRRSVTTGLAAAVAAVPALGHAVGTISTDAELRHLWEQYVVQLEIASRAWAAHRRLRKSSGYDAEYDSLRPKYQHRGGVGDLHDLLWKKHGLEPSAAISDREHRKHRRIVKAIRKVKAESLFGIGVKLSAWEDWDHIHEEEFAEVIDNIRRDIAALTGVDFIAATDRLIV